MTTYNIIYDKTLDLEQLKTSIESTGAAINKTFPNIGVINLTSDNLDFTSVDGVVVHEEDLNIEVMESNDPYNAEWYQYRIISDHLPMTDAYFPPNVGTDVIVYLVDTAIDLTHPEFTDRNIVNFWAYDNTFDAPYGHGTSMASLIVGNTLGMAPGCQVKSVVIPFGPSIPITTLIAAFDAIIEDHDESVVSVVSCSWLIQKSQILDTKILELQQDNIVVVASAGNGGNDADNYSPVGLNTVLGVGASDAYDRVISWGSGQIMNYGEEVDITTPGIDIKVAISDTSDYAITSGTSNACAITAGVVAQYIYRENVTNGKNFSAEQIQSTIILNAGENFLFRDETVYGTTPNRLLYMSIDYTKQNIYYLQPGETKTITFDFNSNYISHLNWNDITLTNGRTYMLPPFVSVSGSMNETITIEAPVVDEGFYGPLYVQLIDHDDQVKDLHKHIAVVWVTEEDKINMPFGDGYLGEGYQKVEDADGNVYVTVIAQLCNYACPGSCQTIKGCSCGAFCLV